MRLGQIPSPRYPQPPMFVPYEVKRLRGCSPHPAPIVESASMAAVLPPIITYRPALPPRLIGAGLLSDLQLESVCYAGQRHEQRLPNGGRAGFFVGHGTGVGKCRILAAIIADNWNQGRRRILWFSVNEDLIEAARRDLQDLGLGYIPLQRLSACESASDIEDTDGVIFSSYASLIAESADGQRRIDQIQRWLGREALVIFDEAHKAKNGVPDGHGKSTQTAQAVIDLQSAELNPDYRIVYSSATGATDVRHMVYMTRLGLWGPRTPFPTFDKFMTEIERGGVGAMEMVSRDMKARGMYVSGTISYGICPKSGLAVEYREVVQRLTPEQREMYDAAAAAWQLVMGTFNEALRVTGGGKSARSQAMNQFWAGQQSFFRQLICAFKVPTVITETERAIAEGKAVVISLVGTGEARTREQVARAVASNNSLDNLDFTPREVIRRVVGKAFPTTLYRDVIHPVTGKTYQKPVTDENGHIVQSDEALRMKQDLLARLSNLKLPENPLDQLLNYFGDDKVAELTGRTRQLIRDPHTKKTVYKKRAPHGVAMRHVNIYEMHEFQAGRKLIAIISDAASMGISLHASNRTANRRRRVHITLELGWSADKQMQTFGRVHRADQAMPPEFVLISTDLGGERRFSSTIAKRLGRLGALTKGERRAADGNEFYKYNFETEEGRIALASVFKSILRCEEVPGLEDGRQTLRDMGLLTKDAHGQEVILKGDDGNVPRFLNRILALDVNRQNAIFNHFVATFDQVVLDAKEDGTFDEGLTDIDALAVRLAQPPRVVAVDPITGAKTLHYLLDVDRATQAVSFQAANIERVRSGGAFYLHINRGEVILAVPSRLLTNPDTGHTYQTFAIWKPEKPRAHHWKESELAHKCRSIDLKTACDLWEKRHAGIPEIETIQLQVIGGSILPFWERLKIHQDTRLRVVRLTTICGQRIVGATLPQSELGPILHALGIKRHFTTPSEIYTAVRLDDDIIELAEKLALRRTHLRNEPRIEVCGPTYFQYRQLRACGVITEYIQFKPRFFISAEEERGIAMLTRVLESFPPIEHVKDAAETPPDKPLETLQEPPANIIELLRPTVEEQDSLKLTENKASSLNNNHYNDGQTLPKQHLMPGSPWITPTSSVARLLDGEYECAAKDD
jgi:hypothetical protein